MPTSCADIECSFSNYKHTLSNCQKRFFFENLKKILFVQYNSVNIAVDIFKSFYTYL